MPWKIAPVNKNAIQERREYVGDYSVAIVIHYRSGYIVVDELPDMARYAPDDGIEIAALDDWRLRDGSADLEFGANMPAKERKKIEQAFAKSGEDGLTGLGYDCSDSTYHLFGKLKITDMTLDLIKEVRAAVANMEDTEDLRRVILSIVNQPCFSDSLKSDLNAEALRAGLQFGADLFNFREFCELVSQAGGDSALKYEALRLIRDNAADAHDLANVALAAVEQLKDQPLATATLDAALAQASANWERIRIVQVALGTLQDPVRAKIALRGFEDEATSCDCRMIAEAVAESTGDRNWAMHWYAKSLDLVADWEDQYRLIGSIDAQLDDPILASGAYKKYDYLKAAGFGAEYPYWKSHNVDHLILMSSEGMMTSDSRGLHVAEKQALHEAEFWRCGAECHVCLLPGRYAGPITANAWRLSVAGIGSPESIVIDSNAENTIAIEAGVLILENVMVLRENGEDAESYAAICAVGDVTLLIVDCVLKSPGGFAFAAVGDESPRTEIVDCHIVDSANGIYGGAGRTTINNVIYRNIKGFEARDGGNGVLELIEDRHRDIAALVDNKLFFNLYEFDDNWADPDDIAGYRSGDGGDIFERMYYVCALKEDMPKELRNFFASYLPEDFEQRMFPGSMGFHACIGVYNVRTNQLVGIGLGRKDGVFERASPDELDWDDFCAFDHAGLISALYARVEEAGRLHGEYLAADDKEEEAELRDAMDEEWRVLRDAVPTLPSDISEVSGISGHFGRGGTNASSKREIVAGAFDTLLSFATSSECSDEGTLDSILDGFRKDHEQLVQEFDGFRLRLRIDGQGIDNACSLIHEQMSKVDPGVSVRSMWDDGDTVGVTVMTIGSVQSRSMDLPDVARQFMNERGLEGDPDDVDDMGRIEQHGLWNYIYELRDSWIAEIESAIRGEAKKARIVNDVDGEFGGGDVVISGSSEGAGSDRAKEELFVAADAPQRFLDLANLLHGEGGRRRRKVRSIFSWFGFQRRGARAIAFVTGQFCLARLEVAPNWADSSYDGFVEIFLSGGVSPGRYQVCRAEPEDDSNPSNQVQAFPGNPKLIEVPATIADGYLATMARVLSRGEVVVCSVREVLSWFGASRRGRQVVNRVMDAFEKTHVATSPSFDEAPIGGHVTIRLRAGVMAGEFSVQRAR